MKRAEVFLRKLHTMSAELMARGCPTLGMTKLINVAHVEAKEAQGLDTIRCEAKIETLENLFNPVFKLWKIEVPE